MRNTFYNGMGVASTAATSAFDASSRHALDSYSSSSGTMVNALASRRQAATANGSTGGISSATAAAAAVLEDLNDILRLQRKRQENYLQLLDTFSKQTRNAATSVQHLSVFKSEDLMVYNSIKQQEQKQVAEDALTIKKFAAIKIDEPRQKMFVGRFGMRVIEMLEQGSMKLRQLSVLDRERERERQNLINTITKHLQNECIDVEAIVVNLIRFFARSIGVELDKARVAMTSGSALMMLGGGCSGNGGDDDNDADTAEECGLLQLPEQQVSDTEHLKELLESTSSPKNHTQTQLLQLQQQQQLLRCTQSSFASAQQPGSLDSAIKAQQKFFKFYAKKFFGLYDVMALDKAFMREEVAQLRIGKTDKHLFQLTSANAISAESLKQYRDQVTASKRFVNGGDISPETKKRTHKSQHQQTAYIQRLLDISFFGMEAQPATSQQSPILPLPAGTTATTLAGVQQNQPISQLLSMAAAAAAATSGGKSTQTIQPTCQHMVNVVSFKAATASKAKRTSIVLDAPGIVLQHEFNNNPNATTAGSHNNCDSFSSTEGIDVSSLSAQSYPMTANDLNTNGPPNSSSHIAHQTNQYHQPHKRASIQQMKLFSANANGLQSQQQQQQQQQQQLYSTAAGISSNQIGAMVSLSSQVSRKQQKQIIAGSEEYAIAADWLAVPSEQQTIVNNASNQFSYQQLQHQHYISLTPQQKQQLQQQQLLLQQQQQQQQQQYSQQPRFNKAARQNFVSYYNTFVPSLRSTLQVTQYAVPYAQIEPKPFSTESGRRSYSRDSPTRRKKLSAHDWMNNPAMNGLRESFLLSTSKEFASATGFPPASAGSSFAGIFQPSNTTAHPAGANSTTQCNPPLAKNNNNTIGSMITMNTTATASTATTTATPTGSAASQSSSQPTAANFANGNIAFNPATSNNPIIIQHAKRQKTKSIDQADFMRTTTITDKSAQMYPSCFIVRSPVKKPSTAAASGVTASSSTSTAASAAAQFNPQSQQLLQMQQLIPAASTRIQDRRGQIVSSWGAFSFDRESPIRGATSSKQKAATAANSFVPGTSEQVMNELLTRSEKKSDSLAKESMNPIPHFSSPQQSLQQYYSHSHQSEAKPPSSLTEISTATPTTSHHSKAMNSPTKGRKVLKKSFGSSHSHSSKKDHSLLQEPSPAYKETQQQQQQQPPHFQSNQTSERVVTVFEATPRQKAHLNHSLTPQKTKRMSSESENIDPTISWNTNLNSSNLTSINISTNNYLIKTPQSSSQKHAQSYHSRTNSCSNAATAYPYKSANAIQDEIPFNSPSQPLESTPVRRIGTAATNSVSQTSANSKIVRSSSNHYSNNNNNISTTNSTAIASSPQPLRVHISPPIQSGNAAAVAGEALTQLQQQQQFNPKEYAINPNESPIRVIGGGDGRQNRSQMTLTLTPSRQISGAAVETIECSEKNLNDPLHHGPRMSKNELNLPKILS